MSPRRPSSSSSVSRKTSLSSTKATRTPINPSLLGAQEDGIPRLAAFVHLDLEPGMRCGELRDDAVERRRLRSGEQRQQPARLGEQAREHGPRDLLEARALCHTLTLDDACPASVALVHRAG